MFTLIALLVALSWAAYLTTVAKQKKRRGDNRLINDIL